MTVEILPATREDLVAGFTFYEEQESGLGSYFLHSLIADIDSLRLYAGVHVRSLSGWPLTSGP